MRRNIFYFTFQSNPFKRNTKQKCFSIVKSIKFYSFDVKAFIKKVAYSIPEHIVTIFQNGSILFLDFTSNIFELHESKKTGGKGKL